MDSLKAKCELARSVVLNSWEKQDFNHFALSYFDLNSGEVASVEIHEGEVKSIPNFYFDLASLTKPLSLGALYLKSPTLFVGDFLALLEHRAGLPRWAILGRKSWKDTVLQYEMKDAKTLYSDLSFLRLMLEIESSENKDLKEMIDEYWHSEMCFWKDLPDDALCPETGFRGGESIQGAVNDDNCYKINRFCSHAGLFGTINGLTQSLMGLEKHYSLLDKMSSAFNEKRHQRFLCGWDTVSDSKQTLAGIDCPQNTFGHLGFTGTSVWIDADSGRGWALLTNATKKYWFHRDELNKLRRHLGELCWKQA